MLIGWRTQKRPLVLCIDANARVGSVVDEVVGPFQAEVENAQGKMFREAMAKARLYLPSTFEQCASGVCPHTWYASNGAPHRLDYIALPSEAKALSVRVREPGDFDVSISRLDHVPVIVAMQVTPELGPSWHKRKKPMCDVRALSDPE
eukprot:14105904-Alexandrium_andersonii.AAC.1